MWSLPPSGGRRLGVMAKPNVAKFNGNSMIIRYIWLRITVRVSFWFWLSGVLTLVSEAPKARTSGEARKPLGPGYGVLRWATISLVHFLVSVVVT